MSQPFTRSFDMRSIGRAEWLQELQALDAEATQALGGPVERRYYAQGTQTVVEWVRAGPLVLSDAPQSPNTTQGLGQFDRKLAIAVQEVKRMGKLGSIAERIAQKKAAHDKKADEWAARLDKIDADEQAAFAMGDAVVAEREQDLSVMEADLRQLSNGLAGPLPASQPGSS